jgi:hypothetical protein
MRNKTNRAEKDDYKLQCRYCGVIMGIDRHSACEHSNSAYSVIIEQMLLTDFMEETENEDKD